MNKIYDRLSISSSIVAIGFRTNKFEFDEYIAEENIDLGISQNQIKFSKNFPIANMHEILNSIPVIAYNSSDNKYNVVLSFPEAKISITKLDFDENNNNDFEIFVRKLLENHLSQIQAVGINYNATFKRYSKLKLFNKNIEDKEFFKKNISFSVTIPYEYDEGVIATYTIKKITQDNEEKSEERVYNISANYNFDTKKLSALDKCKQIPKYIDNSSKNLYNSFMDTCGDFLSLEYGQ